ncbi:unnamed protein product [Orchesella dallaii]|uniref:Uncharacterized protein n=1 Tax=Orchesella dallaii TaxID=48710 RepID=A0ABP1RM65_9HEXA
MRSRKPFRMKGLLGAQSCICGTFIALFGAIALVQIPVAGINVPYNRNGDPTDMDLSYSYVLNKDVRHRKPKYFSNFPTSSLASNSDNTSSVNKNLTSASIGSNPITVTKGDGATFPGIVSSSSSLSKHNGVTSLSTSSSDNRLALLSRRKDERLDFIHHPSASYRPISHSSNTRDRIYGIAGSNSNGAVGGVMTPGFNRFGFATGPTPTFNSGSSSSPFSTRRGDSFYSGTSNLQKYDKNRKGYDRGVDNESLYRPIGHKGSSSSTGSGNSNGGLYNNKDKFTTGTRYGTQGSSSHNDKMRPFSYERLTNNGGSNANNNKDMSLSQMLDMSSTNGNDLDLQHKMQIQELLYTNSSRSSEDARNLAVIPQNCWHAGKKYGCALSVSCVLQGSKPLDLCNGGMIWACCVPREKASESSSSVGILDNPPMSSNKSYPYDLYSPPAIDHSNPNRRPYTYGSSSLFTSNNQLSSSSQTAALTSPFDNPMNFPYRPSFSSADRLVTSKPSYFNRPSYNFYRPTTYKPLLSQTTLSLSLDSESYPLYPGDVFKFGNGPSNPPSVDRPSNPFNSINNHINYHPSSPPQPPPPPLPPIPPSPPLTTQHPYDHLHTNDIYGPIGGHDKYFDKYDHKYGSNNKGGTGSSSSSHRHPNDKISSISPKGN